MRRLLVLGPLLAACGVTTVPDAGVQRFDVSGWVGVVSPEMVRVLEQFARAAQGESADLGGRGTLDLIQLRREDGTLVTRYARWALTSTSFRAAMASVVMSENFSSQTECASSSNEFSTR